jgi:hypothetical protein
MGDRANIYLVDTNDAKHGIYLYTHGSGYEWPEHLRKALDFGRDRWGDEQYLARVITTSVFANIADQTSGGGVSTVIGDNSYPIIVADLVNSQVHFAEEGKEKERQWSHGRSFAEYVAQGRATYPGPY